MRKMTQTTPPPATTTTAPKPKSRTVLIAIIIVILIVVGVGVYYYTLPPPTKRGTPVSIFDNNGTCTNSSNCGFSPQTLTVKIGTNNTITWTNNGQQPHTATTNQTQNGSLPSFDSQNLNHGQQYTTTIGTAGTYHYYCRIHIFMVATLVVNS